MVDNLQNNMVFGLSLLSGILKTKNKMPFRKLNLFPSSGEGERHLLFWARYKELTSITGVLLQLILENNYLSPAYLCWN
jgi:hypothetical protein